MVVVATTFDSFKTLKSYEKQNLTHFKDKDNDCTKNKSPISYECIGLCNLNFCVIFDLHSDRSVLVQSFNLVIEINEHS